MNNTHREIEFKYDASGMTDKQIEAAIRALKPIRTLKVAGWDSFYENDKHAVRYREDKRRPELTIKRRLSNKSMADRIECNLRISSINGADTIKAWLSLVGNYKHTFSIFKACRIYFFENVDIVIYDVFDSGRVKVGRFLEIEFLEHVPATVSKSLKTIERYEKLLGQHLPIGPKQRLNKSLYEMYSPKMNKRRGKKK